MWKSLNWVVISSEKNWRLQLNVSISMLWSSSGESSPCKATSFTSPYIGGLPILSISSFDTLFTYLFILFLLLRLSLFSWLLLLTLRRILWRMNDTNRTLSAWNSAILKSSNATTGYTSHHLWLNHAPKTTHMSNCVVVCLCLSFSSDLICTAAL